MLTMLVGGNDEQGVGCHVDDGIQSSFFLWDQLRPM